MAILMEKYNKEIVPQLIKALGLKNPMQVPHVSKVVINVGVGKNFKDQQYVDKVEKNLVRIAGQRPVKTLAKKSISNFKIRQGNVIGLKVTLRGKRMFDFIEKLVRITMPRVRDFRGLSKKSFDSNGNYSLGFHEHMAFPEIKSDEVDMIHGLEITIHTTAKSKEEGVLLLESLGFPFTK